MSNELTYPERAGAIARDSRINCCEEAGWHWLAAVEAKKEIEREKIRAFNELREAGIKLNEASGREQLTFNLNGKDFVRKELLTHLPDGMTLSQVQCCCHIANTVQEPVKTIEELRVEEEKMQPFFEEHFGESKKKIVLTSHAAKNLFSTIVTKTQDWSNIFDELVEEEPIEKWSGEQLDEFIEKTRPIVERRDQAIKIRLHTV
jgi:hypothetical protein